MNKVSLYNISPAVLIALLAVASLTALAMTVYGVAMAAPAQQDQATTADGWFYSDSSITIGGNGIWVVPASELTPKSINASSADPSERQGTGNAWTLSDGGSTVCDVSGINSVNWVSYEYVGTQLYGWGSSNTCEGLYTIDPSSSSATLVGDTNTSSLYLGYRNGTLYAFNTADDIYTVNVSTGALTDTGRNISTSNGINLSISGATVVNDNVYVLNSGSGGYLYHLNVDTGSATLIYTFPNEANFYANGNWRRGLAGTYGEPLGEAVYTLHTVRYSQFNSSRNTMLRLDLSGRASPTTPITGQPQTSLWFYSPNGSIGTFLGDMTFEMGQGYYINTSASLACTESNAERLTEFYNTDYTISGNIANSPCTLDYDNDASQDDQLPGSDDKSPAKLYDIRFSSTRTVSMQFSPLTDCEYDFACQYKIRIRQGSFTGQYIEAAEMSGGASFTISGISLAANQSYYVEVVRAGVGGSGEFTLAIQYAYIQEPTPTPIATPTPRPAINIDVRLRPDTTEVNFVIDESHAFVAEGLEEYFPLTLRSTNTRAVKLLPNATPDCVSAGELLTGVGRGSTFYITACASGNAQVNGFDPASGLVLQRPVYVGGAPITVAGPGATPGPMSVSRLLTPPSDAVSDPIGFTTLVSEVCSAANIQCNLNLTRWVATLVLVAVSFGIPPVLIAGVSRSAREATSTPALALGIVFFYLGLMLSVVWLGMNVAILVVFGFTGVVIAGIGVLAKVKGMI